MRKRSEFRGIEEGPATALWSDGLSGFKSIARRMLLGDGDGDGERDRRRGEQET
jgi:hypothetical protein